MGWETGTDEATEVPCKKVVGPPFCHREAEDALVSTQEPAHSLERETESVSLPRLGRRRQWWSVVRTDERATTGRPPTAAPTELSLTRLPSSEQPPSAMILSKGVYTDPTPEAGRRLATRYLANVGSCRPSRWASGVAGGGWRGGIFVRATPCDQECRRPGRRILQLRHCRWQSITTSHQWWDHLFGLWFKRRRHRKTVVGE